MGTMARAAEKLKKKGVRSGSDGAKHEGLKREFDQARQAVEQYDASATQTDQSMIAIMRHVFAINEETEKSDAATEYVRALYKEAGIKATKRTPNVYTPLMKLIAPKLPRTTSLRSAAALDYARMQNISAQAIGDFIIDNGGIVKCAESQRAAKRPTEDQRKAEKADDLLAALRSNGKRISDPVLRDGLKDGIWCCLIERTGDHLTILSFKACHAGRDFKPLSDEEFLDFH